MNSINPFSNAPSWGSSPSSSAPRRRWSRRAILGGLTAGLLIAALAARTGRFLWNRRPSRYRFHESDMRILQSAAVCLDRYGHEIWARPAPNDCWCIPVRLEQISPWVRRAIVAVEDRRFYSHPGVDWRSVLRALFSDIRAGRIVSGASTITMQLAKLTAPEPRSWGAKLRQTCRALDIERRHDKAWILEHYLNLAPFGGNLIGIEAAARAYFGKHAADLTIAEATLLAGLPQRPTALRPDQHFLAARMRQLKVLFAMERNGDISRAQLVRIWHSPIYLVLSHNPDPATGISNRLGIPMREPFFARLALASAPSGQTVVRSTLDPRIQALARTALANAVARLPGVHDGAAVVIENAGGAVRALVGTVDFARVPGGQINGACIRRSPGSALKPFVYLLALDEGRLVPETLLLDAPLAERTYRPHNFDRRYRGRVSARDALALSLNTPAVRVLREVGVGRFLEALRNCGLRSPLPAPDQVGLSAALGGVEISLLDLTNLYAGLARGGRFYPCRFLARPQRQRPAAAPFAPGSVALLTDILESAPLPGGDPRIPLAWKTGTSSGRRDAWCVAWNREYTIGVWLGNKNGRPAEALVGAEAAAPVVAAIAEGLYGPGKTPPPVQTLDLKAVTVPVRLATDTGLRAPPGCRDTFLARRPRGVPLRSSPARKIFTASAQARRPALHIVSPAPGVYLADEKPQVTLKIAGNRRTACAWFVDDRFIARSRTPLWVPFNRGRHRILCVADSGRRSAEITIQVR